MGRGDIETQLSVMWHHVEYWETIDKTFWSQAFRNSWLFSKGVSKGQTG